MKRHILPLNKNGMLLALNVQSAAKTIFGGRPQIVFQLDPITIAACGWVEAGTIEVGEKAYDYYMDRTKYVFMEA